MINKQLAKAMIEIKRLVRNQGRSNFVSVNDLNIIIKDINFKELELIYNETPAEKGKEALKRLRERN